MAVAVKVGPWGTSGGDPRDIPDGSIPQSLVSITICTYGLAREPILGISFVYIDQHGNKIIGGPWGIIDRNLIIVDIEMGADEYLYHLSGTADDSHLFSLGLVTNRRHYKFGFREGSPFSVRLGNGKVVAFFCHCRTATIKALGIYVSVMQGSPVKISPWGGFGGEPVDITRPVQLKSVTVYSTHGNVGRIYGISFTYSDLSGQPTITDTWGMTEGEPPGMDVDQFPVEGGEYVNNMTGTADIYGVTSLKFTTNRNERGPYGSDKGTAFSVPLPADRDDNGAVVAFFGRSAESLIAIGAYVGLAPHAQPGA